MLDSLKNRAASPNNGRPPVVEIRECENGGQTVVVVGGPAPNGTTPTSAAPLKRAGHAEDSSRRVERQRRFEEQMQIRDQQWQQIVEAHKREADQYRAIAERAGGAEGRAKIQELEDKLRRAQDEHASLRSHLQLHETYEPGIIAAEFSKINRSIDSLCRSTAEVLMQRFKFKDHDEPTTRLAAHRSQLEKHLGIVESGHATLIRSKTNVGRPLEDFLDYALRSLVNIHLYEIILKPFHPELLLNNADTATFLADIYTQLRIDEPQAVSGKWRASTFAAIDRKLPSGTDFVDDVTSILEKDYILKMLSFLYGTTVKVYLPETCRTQLRETVASVYEWNRKVKSSVILLDYHPQIARNGAIFESQAMDFLEKPKGRAIPEKIISASTLGLMSSEAHGHGQEPAFIWQEKIKVLTEGFFEGD